MIKNNQNICFTVLFFTFILFFSSSQAQFLQSCADTSFRIRYFSSDNIAVKRHTATADHGTIMVGSTALINENRSHGLIARFDAIGNIMWSKKISVPYGSMILSEIRELRNGDFLVGGQLFTDSTKVYLARIDANGNFLWQNIYSPDNRFDLRDYSNLYALEEAPSGSLFFSFSCSHFDATIDSNDSTYSVVAKLTGSGDPMWSKAFTVPDYSDNFPYVNPVGLYYQNGKVLLLGELIDNFSSCPTTNLTLAGTSFFGMSLDEATGALQNFKRYCYSEISSNQLSGQNIIARFGATRLLNNEFAVFGKFYSYTNQNTYLFKVLFDEALNLSKPSIYQLPRFSGSSQINVQSNGNVNLTIGGSSANQYWAQLDSTNKIIRQRKIRLSQTVSSVGRLAYDFKLPDYTTYSTDYKANNKWYIEYAQLQAHDPILDSCLGTDTAFVSVLPFTTTPSPFSWRSITDNPVISIPVNFQISDQILEPEPVCTKIISRCDSLRIDGPDTICASKDFFAFQGQKNPDCRKRVLWEFDPALIDSSYQPNDSLLLLRVKPSLQSPQLLRLIASAANCIKARDTIEIILLPHIKPLPPDTVVCGSFNMRLSPGKGAKTYLWQDGSTDSVFIATEPGQYTVTTQTFCGDVIKDTIRITQAKISAGPDITKCDTDTIIMHLTPGLANYKWNPQTSLVFINDSTMKVFPNTTTQYIVSAQRDACIVKDTITINVLTAPAIFIGNDTTFCNGDSLKLQLPDGFVSYRWNNIIPTQVLTVKESGTYWAKVWDNNGCSSADSINILPLHSNPAVEIFPKNVVCIGQTDTLRTTVNFASYYWSNGSSQSFIPVSDIGSYWVKVTDSNGCLGNDTVILTKFVLPPAHFLPADTTICKHSSVELFPDKTFEKYLWSTGSTSKSVKINNAGSFYLQVWDADNCKANDTLVVTQKDCLNKLYFPSAFSPNGDGINDVFRPLVQGVLAQYRLTIYNRWGQVIYTTSDYRMGWNGRFKGSLQADSFVWLCQYRFKEEERKSEKGTLVLIK